jgi:hypothetical protein
VGKKNTHTKKKKKKGQSDILGQKFGQTWKRHSCLGQPRKFIFVSSLKLIQAIHKGKWTWQFGKIVK